MVNAIRTRNPSGLNKGHGLKFPIGSRLRQKPEEGQRIYRSKRCEYNNEDEENTLINLNDKKFLSFSNILSNGH